MKKLALFALVVFALLAGLAWYSFAPRTTSPGSLAPELEVRPSSPERVARPAIPPAVPNSGAQRTSESDDASSGTSASSVVLVGRVVDSDGSPLPLANVRLIARKEATKGSLSAIDRSADELGRFRLVIQDLDVAELSLVLSSDEQHANGTILLRSTSARLARTLQPGENDLGDLALRSAGSIEGLVRDAAGAPLANVGVIPQVPDFWNSRPLTDANGRFLVSRIPPGTWTVRALAAGWITAEIREVVVKPRETTRGLEFVLAPANVIEGRVNDALGRVVPDVIVSAFPVGGGNGGSAKSRADGSFTIPLQAPGEHYVSARAQGYQEFGDVNDRHKFSAGDKLVEIVLTKAVVTTFVVVDAATSRPIELYELSLELRPTSSGQVLVTRQPRSESDAHPRGECAIEADPARHVVRVRAPGYAPFEADVRHDTPPSARQVLRLASGGTLVARALLEGAPVTSGRAVIVRGIVARARPTSAGGEDDGIPITSTYQDLSEFEGRRREVALGANGSLRIEDLATGTYDLTVRAAGAAARTARGIKVEAPGVLDLGDITLRPSATIRGRVLVGPDQSPIGLTIGAKSDESTARVEREDGTFELVDVTPGTVTLGVERMPPILLETQYFQHEFRAGVENEIVLDLTPFLPATLEVMVRERGAPLAGLAVDWIAVLEDGRIERMSGIGTTDANGRVHASCPGGRRLVVRARLGDGPALGSSGAPRLFAGGRAHAITIDLARGDLVIQFPIGKPVPVPGKFTLTLTPVSTDVRDLMTIQRTTPAPGTTPTPRSWTSSRVELGSLAAGDYDVRLSTLALTETDDGPWIAPWSSRISVLAGQVTTLEPR